uniref:Serpentine receptor class gamma n=1 Tax=Strongyloides papillosus TaxID=174720 RepID=A0A0N5CGU5_STREA
MTNYIFLVLPRWGFFNNFLKNNNWMATVFYILTPQQTTFMFLITLLISINRYIAVKYPLSYETFFSKSKVVIILLSFVILSTMIGLGNIPFNPSYEIFDLFGYFIPILKSKSVIYYQFFYTIILFGMISIATCTFNVMAILTIKKLNQNGNKQKRELYYIIYSIFIFITVFFVEAYFICRFIALKYKIKFFIDINYFFNVV